jgi:hypothetical protein
MSIRHGSGQKVFIPYGRHKLILENKKLPNFKRPVNNLRLVILILEEAVCWGYTGCLPFRPQVMLN